MPCFKRLDQQQVEWVVSSTLVPYEFALSIMQERVKQIQLGTAKELVWLLEHPPLYTLGTSAKEHDILDREEAPIFKVGRGGQVTYHGPGQRVIYVMLDLKKRCKDAKAYIFTLEEWLVHVLAQFGLHVERRPGFIGLWVARSLTAYDKVAAFGVRIQKWVTSHGIALNINPDLDYYKKIIPCGIRDQGVTSLSALGIQTPLHEVDQALQERFYEFF